MDAVKTPEVEMANWRPEEQVKLEQLRLRVLAERAAKAPESTRKVDNREFSSQRFTMPLAVENVVDGLKKNVRYVWESVFRREI
jgi:hypothetical protein